MFTARPSELRQLLAATYSDGASTEQNTSFVDVSRYHRIQIEILLIDVGTSLDVDVEVATTSGGANLATLKSITQLTQAGGDDASAVIVEVRSEEMNISGTHHRYLRVESTPSGASDYVIAVCGCEPRYAPVSTTILDEVVD